MSDEADATMSGPGDLTFTLPGARRFINDLSRRNIFTGFAGLGLGAFGASTALAAGMPASGVDIDTLDLEGLETSIRIDGDITGAQTMAYAPVMVFAMMPGERGFPVFGLEVIGCSRHRRIEGGFELLHKEIGYYTDLATGDVMSTWNNPINERTVEVLHIKNDPVNRRITGAAPPPGFGVTQRLHVMGDFAVYSREVFLRYPNPMPQKDYRLYSAGDFYEAVEMFRDFARLEHIADTSMPAVPTNGTWSRIGPWLPWMEMGTRAGVMVYHGHSVKLMNGVEGLPPKLRAYAEKNDPDWLVAPTEYVQPNETSWTYFKKIIDAKRGTTGG